MQWIERPRNGGPDEGMWTSHYLEGMGYECIPGSTSRSLGSEYSDANISAKIIVSDNNYYYLECFIILNALNLISCSTLYTHARS